MAEVIGSISEIRLNAECLIAVVDCPPVMRPAPGQYLLAYAPELNDLLPTALFSTVDDHENIHWLAVGSMPTTWSVGTQLRMRGPIGRGFHLPVSAHSLALAVVDVDLSRLLPLVDQGIRQGAGVTVFSDHFSQDLPASVEVLPLASLPEAVAWADYIALDLDVERLGDWRSLLGLSSGERSPVAGEILVRAPMPCGGRGPCGVCSLRTRLGWQLICRDGPVFPLVDLE